MLKLSKRKAASPISWLESANWRLWKRVWEKPFLGEEVSPKMLMQQQRPVCLLNNRILPEKTGVVKKRRDPMKGGSNLNDPPVPRMGRRAAVPTKHRSLTALELIGCIEDVNEMGDMGTWKCETSARRRKWSDRPGHGRVV